MEGVLCKSQSSVAVFFLHVICVVSQVPLLIDSWLSKLLNPLLGGEATTRFAPLPPGFDRAGQSTTNRATRPQASTPAAQVKCSHTASCHISLVRGELHLSTE